MSGVWLGIDLGTSSTKVIALDECGTVLAAAQQSYGILRRIPGWAEQDPEEWWAATTDAVRTVLAALDADVRVVAVGLSGQMHGVVLVDGDGSPVAPAIIWSDGRAAQQVERWQAEIGDRVVESLTGFRPASGCAGLSLSWLSAHEPQVIARAAAVMQPKDYIRFKLTGRIATEMTDAGASLLFDLERRDAAGALLAAAGISRDLIPEIIATLAPAGAVTDAASASTGLPAGAMVAAGGGDQAMTALALGLRHGDRAAFTLSSGGTVLVPAATAPPGYHRLADAHGGTLGMGVVLAAGLATGWLAGFTGQPERTLLEQAASTTIDDGLFARPHLGGTRTPLADARPQGSFHGVGFEHGPAHLMRAVVEGIAVSLADSYAAIAGADATDRTIVLSGGGSRFAVWRQAVADATGMPVTVSSDLEHAAIGAALAAVAASEATISFDAATRVQSTVAPNQRDVARLQRVRDRAPAGAEDVGRRGQE